MSDVGDDLRCREQCDFLALLKVLLRRVASSGATRDDDDLLEECLNAVLPICNRPTGEHTLQEELGE